MEKVRLGNITKEDVILKYQICGNQWFAIDKKYSGQIWEAGHYKPFNDSYDCHNVYDN